MKIIIPGPPIPQQRFRIFNRGGRSIAFDPCGKDKKRIRSYLEGVVPDNYVFPAFPTLYFKFYMPVPASTPKKRTELANSGVLKHTKRPDVDNLIKTYLDCMNGLVIEDDSHISIGHAIKLYGSPPRTEIEIIASNEIWKPED